jgi:hypothetical protein
MSSKNFITTWGFVFNLPDAATSPKEVGIDHIRRKAQLFPLKGVPIEGAFQKQR